MANTPHPENKVTSQQLMENGWELSDDLPAPVDEQTALQSLYHNEILAIYKPKSIYENSDQQKQLDIRRQQPLFPPQKPYKQSASYLAQFTNAIAPMNAEVVDSQETHSNNICIDKDMNTGSHDGSDGGKMIVIDDNTTKSRA
jgi:hypothetical protein